MAQFWSCCWAIALQYGFWAKQKAHPRMRSLPRNLSILARVEGHLHLFGLVDVLAVQLGGFEHPLFDRIESGIAEDGKAAGKLQVADFPVFAHRELHGDATAQAARASDRRIYRRNFL